MALGIDTFVYFFSFFYFYFYLHYFTRRAGLDRSQNLQHAMAAWMRVCVPFFSFFRLFFFVVVPGVNELEACIFFYFFPFLPEQDRLLCSTGWWLGVLGLAS